MPLPQFIFGGSTGKTQADLKRERDRAKRLSAVAARNSSPKNVGQGLTFLGQAIASRMAQGQAANTAANVNKLGSQAFSSAIDGLYGGTSTVDTIPPQPTSTTSVDVPPPTKNTTNTAAPVTGIKSGILSSAKTLGIDPVDLATAISYETAGTFDPKKRGPTTQWGQHRGLIQFGKPQAKKYGVDWKNPIKSQLGPNGAVVKYLKAAGVKPGMGLLDVYSAINAGRVGRYNASDANNGGAPGTVLDKVTSQMRGHRAKAVALFKNDALPVTDAPQSQPQIQPVAAPPPQPQPQQSLAQRLVGGINTPASSREGMKFADENFSGLAPAPVIAPTSAQPPQSVPVGLQPPQPPQSVPVGLQPPQPVPVGPQQDSFGQVPPQVLPTDASVAPPVGAAPAPVGTPQPAAPIPTAAPATPTAPPSRGQGMPPQLVALLSNPAATPQQKQLALQLWQQQRSQQAAQQKQLAAQRQLLQKQQFTQQQSSRSQQFTREQFDREQQAKRDFFQFQQQNKPRPPVSVPQGNTLVDPTTGKPIYQAPVAAPKPTTGQREYELARSQGFKGSFVDYKKALQKAGAGNVTVNNNGPAPLPQYNKLPAGHVYKRNPDGSVALKNGVPTAVPIPGTPAATKITAAEQKRVDSADSRVISSNIIIKSITDLEGLVKSAPWYNPANGTLAQAVRNVGGTTAFDAQQLATTIKANIGFEALQNMRDNSPTGGALGQVSDRELNTLQAVLGSLDTAQSDGQLLHHLNRIKKLYTNILRKAAAYPNAAKYGFSYTPDKQQPQQPDAQGWITLPNGVKMRRKP